jgi:hypothetical protein
MFQRDQCPQCGGDFFKTKVSTRFCSRSCQRAAMAKSDKAARALYRAALKIIEHIGREAA